MTEHHDCQQSSGRRPSIVGLLWALVFGIVAAIGFTGNFRWVADSGTKWIIAGVIALIGLGLLITALPGRSGGSGGSSGN